MNIEIKKRPQIAAHAKELMNKHGSQYIFGWNKRYSAFGVCNHTKETIYLSEHLINRPLEEIKRTILHEIAHEIVRRKYKNNIYSVKPHGKEWKSVFHNLCAIEGIPVEPSKDHTPIEDSRYKYHIVLTGEENISLQKYVKKPTAKRYKQIESSYLTGKPWTKGQLKIITHEEFIQYRSSDKVAV